MFVAVFIVLMNVKTKKERNYVFEEMPMTLVGFDIFSLIFLLLS